MLHLDPGVLGCELPIDRLAPIRQRFGEEEVDGRAVAFVLVFVPQRFAGFWRQGRAGLLQELHRPLVHAHPGALGVVLERPGMTRFEQAAVFAQTTFVLGVSLAGLSSISEPVCYVASKMRPSVSGAVEVEQGNPTCWGRIVSRNHEGR